MMCVAARLHSSTCHGKSNPTPRTLDSSMGFAFNSSSEYAACAKRSATRRNPQDGHGICARRLGTNHDRGRSDSAGGLTEWHAAVGPYS